MDAHQNSNDHNTNSKNLMGRLPHFENTVQWQCGIERLFSLLLGVLTQTGARNVGMSPKPVPPLQLKVSGGSQQIFLLPLLGAHPIVLGPKLSKLSHGHKFSILLLANTQNVAGIFALMFSPRQLPQ
jgi:hypothetical protein